MRHTLGLLLGILLTPVLVYGVAWSFAQAAASFDPVAGEIADATRLAGAVALMGAAGLVAGVVVVARWASPLLTLVPALTLIGWSVYFFADPGRALDLPARLSPDGLVDQTLDTGLRMLLGSGVFALLGMLLLVPAGTARRWPGRRHAEDDAPFAERARREPEYF